MHDTFRRISIGFLFVYTATRKNEDVYARLADNDGGTVC